MPAYTNDYLLDKKIKIFQPVDGYRASSDAVLLSSAIQKVKTGETILDLGSGTGAISLCLAHRFPQANITGFEIQND
ncbi:MAG: methyltransferase [Alphaproteobacteria bacterium]|nr:methyltransferase [Alphaproteobacteria bacterium]